MLALIISVSALGQTPVKSDSTTYNVQLKDSIETTLNAIDFDCWRRISNGYKVVHRNDSVFYIRKEFTPEEIAKLKELLEK